MDQITGLSVGRIAVGTSALLAPEAAMKAIGLDAENNRQLPLLGRMFASREIAVGVATLLARGRARRAWVVGGIAIDAADAVASILAAQSGSVSKARGAAFTAAALAAVNSGVIGLWSGLRGEVSGGEESVDDGEHR
jgi:hypothetical protein